MNNFFRNRTLLIHLKSIIYEMKKAAQTMSSLLFIVFLYVIIVPISTDPTQNSSPKTPLPRNIHRSFFPDHRHFDLAREGHFCLDFLGNFEAEFIAVAV